MWFIKCLTVACLIYAGAMVLLSGKSDALNTAYDCIATSANEYEYMVCTGREYAYFGGYK